MKIIIYMALVVILIPTLSYGEDKHLPKRDKDAVGSLSRGLRTLLSKEMLALQGGMTSIIPAYVSGNWSEIEKTAGKMKNSYIMKQKLTHNQKKELHSKLPSAFIEQDQRFHYLADMLEHAAKNKKAELINFYFSEMNESCVNCHIQFATHKFPALSPKEKNGEHSH